MSEYRDEDSPFHEGERELQVRLGVRDVMERVGRKIIRDHLPDEHRRFYPRLPFLLLGSVDGRGRPWATFVAGKPGFARCPDPRSLVVDARLGAGDPLRDDWGVGSEVGVLGIELATRRRNRVAGSVVRSDERGFTVAVAQTLGNCPKYIQTRALAAVPERSPAAAEPARTSDRLDDRPREMIEKADTFFIATVAGSSRRRANHGADVSHRGGLPGFVRIDDERTLTVPDFPGNRFFNTFGNVRLNPRSGLLFLDFDSGDALYLSGETEVLWDSPEIAEFPGAERLWRFSIEEAVLAPAAFPLRGEMGTYSPALENTGVWRGVRDR